MRYKEFLELQGKMIVQKTKEHSVILGTKQSELPSVVGACHVVAVNCNIIVT